MRTAIYLRVSTLEQAQEGYSISEQTDRLTKYCEARDWTVAKIYTDPGYSGSNMNRPALKMLLNDVKSFDMVLVYKLDRLSRSQKDTLYLIEDVFLKNNVEFVSMNENFDTSTPFGRAMIGILSVFAQLEREQIKERMSMGHVGRAKNGYWRGGGNPPLGYEFVDGKLIVNEYEAMQIRELFDLFLTGMSMHGIANVLREKYTNKYSSWKNAGTICTILRNKMYIGIITYKGVEYTGQHDAIISDDIFNRAAIRYNEINSKRSTHFKSPFIGKSLLSGIIFCGNCDARYFVISAVNKKYGQYSYYKCYSRDGNSKMKKIDGCKNPNYKVEVLDKIVIDEILKLGLDKQEIKKIHQCNTAVPNNKIETLTRRVAAIDTQIEKLIELYQIGSIPVSEITKRVDKLHHEKNSLEKEILNTEKIVPILSIDEAYNIVNNSKSILLGNDLKEKKIIVNSLISKIIIGENDIKIYWKFC